MTAEIQKVNRWEKRLPLSRVFRWTAWWSTSPLGPKQVRAATASVLTLSLLLSGCGDSRGFRCGVDNPATGLVPTCSGSAQVCVCATNSCAEWVSDRVCAGRLRYLKEPDFAASESGCVTADDLDWLAQGQAGPSECGVPPEQMQEAE
jgi:hypothetical protein